MLTAFEELQKLLKEANEGTLTVQYYFLDTVQYFKVGNILWKVKAIALIQLITLNIDDSSHRFEVFRPIVFSYLWLKCCYMYIGRRELDSRLQEQENSHAEKTKDYGECLSICQILPQGSKKIIFTACHSGKLKLAFTSPTVISTSPKSFLTSRIDFTLLPLFELLKKHHLPVGQVKNKIH